MDLFRLRGNCRPGARAPTVGARLAVGLCLVVAVSAGCTFVDLVRSDEGWRPGEPSLDGWPLGSELDCGRFEQEEGLVTLAREQLAPERRAQVVAVGCYNEGLYFEHGQPVMMSGGGRGVGMAMPVVFTFADGSQTAIGVGCGTWAYESGPNVLHHGQCGLRDPIRPAGRGG